jgi:hypothetical protein
MARTAWSRPWSKSPSSAAIRLRNGEASKVVSSRTGDLAWLRPRRSSSTPVPTAVMGPSRVTTMRLSGRFTGMLQVRPRALGAK